MPDKEKNMPIKSFNLKEAFLNFYNKLNEITTLKDISIETLVDFIVALIPAAILGAVIFGWYAALILTITTATAILLEFLWNLIFKKPQTLGLLSAAATGLLLGMCLPPTVPFWVAILISFIAILAKQIFLLIKQAPLNYIALARVALVIIFPAIMTKFVTPFSLDAISAATPLASIYGDAASATTVKEAFFGIHGGCIGETSVFFLLIGGIYLIIKRIVDPIVPVFFIGSFALASLIAGQNLLLSIFGGGLILAALFIATESATLPRSIIGKIAFGVGCGIITFIIRFFGILAEGVSCAILIVSLLNYCINLLIKYNAFEFLKEKAQIIFTKEFFKGVLNKITALFQKVKSFLQKYIHTKSGDNS